MTCSYASMMPAHWGDLALRLYRTHSTRHVSAFNAWGMFEGATLV
jgi:hypothetical protein